MNIIYTYINIYAYDINIYIYICICYIYICICYIYICICYIYMIYINVYIYIYICIWYIYIYIYKYLYMHMIYVFISPLINELQPESTNRWNGMGAAYFQFDDSSCIHSRPGHRCLIFAGICRYVFAKLPMKHRNV